MDEKMKNNVFFFPATTDSIKTLLDVWKKSQAVAKKENLCMITANFS